MVSEILLHLFIFMGNHWLHITPYWNTKLSIKKVYFYNIEYNLNYYELFTVLNNR